MIAHASRRITDLGRRRLLAAALAGASALLSPGAAIADGTDAAHTELLDRAAIHRLLLDYGRTLDARNFEEFGRLFTEDGEYGPAGAMTVGPAAIGEGMRAAFANNPLGFADPNFHVFFNEEITLQGDTAEASSMSFYVVPGENGEPRIAMMAQYRDALVRVGGEWKFGRREVHSLLPATRGRP